MSYLVSRKQLQYVSLLFRNIASNYVIEYEVYQLNIKASNLTRPALKQNLT